METVEYNIFINAAQNLVWEKLWDKVSYAQWTQFSDPVYELKTDWKVGGKTYFIEADGNGMVSTITSLDAPNEVIFQHRGRLVDGVEVTKGPTVAEWSGIEEKYFLRTLDSGAVELRVILRFYKHQRAAMDEGFHKGLQLLKEICEN